VWSEAVLRISVPGPEVSVDFVLPGSLSAGDLLPGSVCGSVVPPEVLPSAVRLCEAGLRPDRLLPGPLWRLCSRAFLLEAELL